MADDSANPFAKYVQADAAPNPFAKYASGGSKFTPASLGIPEDKGSLSGAIVHGASFGLSDEVMAGLSAPLQYGIDSLTGKKPKEAGLGDYYDANLDNLRHGQEKFKQEHPVQSAVGELAGGVMDLNPAAVGNVVSHGVKEAIAQGAKVGGAMGAASGFGDAEGGVIERAKGAATGGAMGAAIGAAAPVAVPWLVGASRQVRDMVANAISPFSGDIDSFITKVAGDVLHDTAGKAVPEFHEGPLPDMHLSTGQSTGDPGLLWLERSAEQSSPEAARAFTANRTANNQALHEAIGGIGDLETEAGPAMRDALGRNLPADSGEDRVLDLARDKLGDSGFYETGASLNKSRSAQAAPLYEKAMNNGAVIDDRVNQFLADPILKQGITKGLQIQRLEALAENHPFDPKQYGIVGFNDAGDPIIGGVPNMRLLDAAKKGLDDIVEGFRNPLTGKLNLDQFGRAVNNVRAGYVKALDAANPDYAAARSAWSGPSQSLDALHAGRGIFRGDSEMTAQKIGNLAPGDADYFRIGVLRAIEDTVNNSPNGAGALKSMLAKPKVQEKLAAAFQTPEDFQNFSENAAQILNPPGAVAKATAKNSAGAFKMPDSAVADEFIQKGKGAPEAFQSYLDAVGEDPAGQQAARDAFAQKFLKRVQTTVPDEEGDRVLSASKIAGFLDDYKHVIDSPIFSAEQRDMIRRIGDAADMAQRTARAGAKGGSDTFAKLSGKSYLDVLIGPGASKIAPVAGALVGGHLAGPVGAAAGAVGGFGLNKLEQTLYGASRDKVVALINEAMANPELAKALMMQASKKSALQMPVAQRRLIYSILGADFVDAGREAMPNSQAARTGN
jgi:hypothetical protein